MESSLGLNLWMKTSLVGLAFTDNSLEEIWKLKLRSPLEHAQSEMPFWNRERRETHAISRSWPECSAIFKTDIHHRIFGHCTRFQARLSINQRQPHRLVAGGALLEWVLNHGGTWWVFEELSWLWRHLFEINCSLKISSALYVVRDRWLGSLPCSYNHW